jgi:hypothetical protein
MADSMKPLDESWAWTDAEQEMKDIFIKLYEDAMKEQADEINVYGVPHLGSFALIERITTADGLSILRDTGEANLRHLFKAWKYRNPKRGLHFLRTYLRAIWGDAQFCEQMWQRKEDPYPTALKSLAEITADGEDVTDYFLTSRIRADIDTDRVPDLLINSLRTTIAARFVLEVRIARFSVMNWRIGQNIGGVTICRAVGSLDVDFHMNYAETSLNGESIRLRMSGTPIGDPTDGFSITVNGSSAVIDSGYFDGRYIVLVPAVTILNTDDCEVSYDDVTGSVTSSKGPLESFTDEPVRNISVAFPSGYGPTSIPGTLDLWGWRDLSRLWETDALATNCESVGDPVGAWRGELGNYTLSTATSTARLEYQTTGILANSASNTKMLEAAFAQTANDPFFVCVRANTATVQAMRVGAGTATANTFQHGLQNGAVNGLQSGRVKGTLTGSAESGQGDKCSVMAFDGAAAYLIDDSGTKTTLTVGATSTAIAALRLRATAGDAASTTFKYIQMGNAALSEADARSWIAWARAQP